MPAGNLQTAMAKGAVTRKVPVVSFVGNSGVGKTSFLEKLVRTLKNRGYRVATIKHDIHNFQIDHPGKDSWRLTEAGSDVVVLSSPRRLALLEEVGTERTLDDLVDMVAGRMDIVLTEGYRRAGAAKIESSREAHGTALTATPEALIAIVTETIRSIYRCLSSAWTTRRLLPTSSMSGSV